MNTTLRDLTRDDLEALLPHRAPMLLLHGVDEVEPGVSGRATRVFEADDPVFEGHFPGQPIVPGVLIVEACAQLVAVVMATVEAGAGPSREDRGLDLMASIDRFKFLAPVGPGTRLLLEARIGKRVGHVLQAAVAARIGRQTVAEGKLAVTLSGSRNGP